jgi:hypothetical protein
MMYFVYFFCGMVVGIGLTLYFISKLDIILPW